MKAILGLDYDYKTDKCFKRPVCPDCDAPVLKFKTGEYKCISCRRIAEVDEGMMKWLADREGEKVEYEDCPQFEVNGTVYGCGGKKTVETHYVKNNVTLKWETAWGQCNKCGKRFIV